MTQLHEGKVAVVTGGANGFGRELVAEFAAQGADVGILDIGDPSEAIALVEKQGRRAVAIECDVTDVAAVQGAETKIREELGAASILVNNVGIYPFIPFAELDLDAWRKVMSINLDSFFIVSSAFVPAMREKRWGRVINITSNTFHGGAFPNYVHYITSKGGVVGFTRGLANELGPDNITVNGIAPGLTQTEKVKAIRTDEFLDEVAETQIIKRRMEPDDIVGAVSFLASEGAGFITAQTFPVDGGVARV